ncbi:MAG TPA: flagellar basal body rod protein FlgC [Solirubrobacteraceae bacterium]|nr:flagellar basal body rod protein FlgC [Solirubrobacteraceae bacterium]
MSFFDAISIAASGLTAERTRMDVTSENLANADTTQGANGQPYQEQEVELQTVGGSNSFSNVLSGAMGAGSSSVPAGGVEVTGIVSSSTPDQEVYDPGTPGANAQGYVKMPNVNSVNEMVDMVDESNSYQSDITAMNTAKDMFEKTLDLLK